MQVSVCAYCSMCVFMSMHESIFFMYMLYVVNVCLCDASVTGAELIAADGCRRVETYIQNTDTGRSQRERARRECWRWSVYCLGIILLH